MELIFYIFMSQTSALCNRMFIYLFIYLRASFSSKEGLPVFVLGINDDFPR